MARYLLFVLIAAVCLSFTTFGQQAGMQRVSKAQPSLMDGVENRVVEGETFGLQVASPLTMSYQGLLTTSIGTPAADGDYDIDFSLWDALTLGSSVWTETHSAVPVSQGTFSVILGSAGTPLTGVNFNQQLYVEVEAPAGPEGPAYPLVFSPRSTLASAPSALAPWVISGNNIHFDEGYVGIGTAPGWGFHVNRPVVVDDNDIAFRRDGAHRWRIQEGATTGLEIKQVYADGGGLLNSVRFAVADDGNVGMGKSSPEKKLDVAGSIQADDTVFASAFVYNPPKTGYITGTAWATGRAYLTGESASFGYQSGLVNTDVSARSYRIDLQIPDGVTITEATCYGYDGDATTELDFSLRYHTLTLPSASLIASSSSGIAFSGGATSIVLATSHVVNNGSRAYHLGIEFPPTTLVKMYSYRITYTYDNSGSGQPPLTIQGNAPDNMQFLDGSLPDDVSHE